MEANWPAIYKLLLQFEGGNDDDPQDPGGRTSRGILQREWTPYRATHQPPPLPSDVWRAPDGVPGVMDIYHNGQYWAGQRCQDLRSGVDAVTMDYGVNSGVGRSGRVLRHVLGLPTNTYHIDDTVIAALAKRDPKAVVDAICDERMAFLRSLRTFGRFGGGWTRRVNQDRAFAEHLIVVGPAVPTPIVPTKAPGKAQHPEPTVTKNVVKTGGVVGAGGFAYLADWIGAHPMLSAGIMVATIAGIIFLVDTINKWHQQRQVTPMPGTPVVPEMGVAT